jgi:hypothetical protein
MRNDVAKMSVLITLCNTVWATSTDWVGNKFWWFFGDFYVIFQRENHFINKRFQKPRRLNLKCIPAVNNVNKINRNRYNSVLKILCKFFYCQLKQLLLLTLYYILFLLFSESLWNCFFFVYVLRWYCCNGTLDSIRHL